MISEIEYQISTPKALQEKFLDEMEKTMNTMMKQNNAPIPPPIAIAYKLIYSRLTLQLFPPVL